MIYLFIGYKTCLQLFVFLSHSASSKQRKNVISCVTVHDSPDSDSSNNSPYAVRSRTGATNANNYDSKATVLDNYSNGNSRTIIIPPLKSQTSENLSECDRLLPGEFITTVTLGPVV